MAQNAIPEHQDARETALPPKGKETPVLEELEAPVVVPGYDPYNLLTPAEREQWLAKLSEENRRKLLAMPSVAAPPPTRSLQERFENAEIILMRDRMKWTPAQEEHFLMKWQELCDLYKEEYPGTEWPCLRYNKDGFLETEKRLMSFWKVVA